jgi:hypothetical protein
MSERTVAPNEVRGKPMIKMTVGEYYEFLLKEEVREAAAKRGIEIVDERPGPRLVADSSAATVVPLRAAGRGEAE